MQCIAICKNGERCKKYTRIGQNKCHVHHKRDTKNELFTIVGYYGCSWFQKSINFVEKSNLRYISIEQNRTEYLDYLRKLDIKHHTSPGIWLGVPGKGIFIGGYQNFVKYINVKSKTK